MQFGIIDTIFIIFSAFAILSAFFMLAVRDVFRAAIAFIGTLLSLAGLFILLRAEFIGAIQILVNVGAVAIILIVTIMLMRDLRHGSSVTNPGLRIMSVVVGAAFVLGLIFVITMTSWITFAPETELEAPAAAIRDAILGNGGVLDDSVAVTGRLLLREFVLVFEILAIVVASAVIGAISILRGTLTGDDSQNRSEVTPQ